MAVSNSYNLPSGFQSSGVIAHIKKNDQLDLAVLYSEFDCTATALFTTNKVKAASVIRNQQLLSAKPGQYRAVVINAGCANACTGMQGMLDCEESARIVADALNTRTFNDTAHAASTQVLCMSTGVIGVNLPMEKMRVGIPTAVQNLSPEGLEQAARAIMTTDTVPKVATIQVDTKPLQQPRPDARSASQFTDHAIFTISGIAKGSGMIHPNMATMLSVVMTDATVSQPVLDQMLRYAADHSFHCISVDGDTSTNDTLLVLANGASGVPIETDEQITCFRSALTEICTSLAQQLARDGEGATKFITITITGAASEHMAHIVGRKIATSPLVKTAFYGEDANWGRIICAAGYSGEAVIAESMSLWFGDILVFQNGMPTQYSETEATHAIQPHDVAIRLDLGLGSDSATIWTCDLSHDYVTINGKYRT